jgi:hypothetical protein
MQNGNSRDIVESVMATFDGGDVMAYSELPRATLGSERIDGTPWDLTRDDTNSWWASGGLNTYAHDAQPKVECTRDAIFWANKMTHHVDSGCVAVLTMDETAVTYSHDAVNNRQITATFLASNENDGFVRKQFNLDDIANDVTLLHMLPVIDRLRRFERAWAQGALLTKTQMRQSKILEDAFEATSSDVLKRAKLGDRGELVAYADGRLRGTFEDRTILLFDRKRLKARLTLRDGSCITVRVSSPVTGKYYVNTALSFANTVWAPAVNDVAHAPSLDVSATLARNKEWLNWFSASHKREGATALPYPAPLLPDASRRGYIVSAELSKTALWLASLEKHPN